MVGRKPELKYGLEKRQEFGRALMNGGGKDKQEEISEKLSTNNAF